MDQTRRDRGPVSASELDFAPPEVTRAWPPGLAPGTVVAHRYEVLQLFARGAFGAVHEAHDKVTQGQVALKVLRSVQGQEATRFVREGAALRLLRLPGVVQFLDAGDHEGLPFVVTGLVAGAPFPGRGRGRTWAELETPALALLEALARVHAAGVVHRDLKPGNVLVDDAAGRGSSISVWRWATQSVSRSRRTGRCSARRATCLPRKSLGNARTCALNSVPLA
jgi:serine/threonine protein kinase